MLSWHGGQHVSVPSELSWNIDVVQQWGQQICSAECWKIGEVSQCSKSERELPDSAQDQGQTAQAEGEISTWDRVLQMMQHQTDQMAPHERMVASHEKMMGHMASNMASMIAAAGLR